GEELKEVDLGWQEAAVIDELNENPMLTKTELLEALEREHSASKLQPKAPFASILTNLKSQGLLL
ncbi:MAG: hypothetical protein V4760_11635, partial [Bdellovibrionota bacterium]